MLTHYNDCCSFNANPASMESALKTLQRVVVDGSVIRRLAVLGTMADLGTKAALHHRHVSALALSLPGVETICWGSAWGSAASGGHDICKAVLEWIHHCGDDQSTCVILVKGSRETKMEHIREFLQSELCRV